MASFIPGLPSHSEHKKQLSGGQVFRKKFSLSILFTRTVGVVREPFLTLHTISLSGKDAAAAVQSEILPPISKSQLKFLPESRKDTVKSGCFPHPTKSPCLGPKAWGRRPRSGAFHRTDETFLLIQYSFQNSRTFLSFNIFSALALNKLSKFRSEGRVLHDEDDDAGDGGGGEWNFLSLPEALRAGRINGRATVG